jgi:hypothetical protein
LNIYFLKQREIKSEYVEGINGYVIISETERSARKLAASECGNENVWLNSKFSSIKLIGISNNRNVKEEIVLMDEF